MIDNVRNKIFIEFVLQPECIDETEPCSKIYIDKYASDKKNMVIGYNFLCACPTGMKCPDRKEDEEEQAFKSDFRGTYIPQYCELVHKGARR